MISFGSTEGHSNSLDFGDAATLEGNVYYAVAMWLKKLGSTTAQRSLLADGLATSGGFGGWGLRSGDAGFVRVRHADNVSGFLQTQLAADSWDDTNIHSLFIAWTPPSNVLRVYVDGIFISSATHNQARDTNALPFVLGNLSDKNNGWPGQYGHLMYWHNFPQTAEEADANALIYHLHQTPPRTDKLTLWHKGLAVPGIDEIGGITPTAGGTVTFVADAVDAYYGGGTIGQHVKVATHRLLHRAFEEHRHTLRVPLSFLTLELMDPINISHDALLRSASHLATGFGQETHRLYDKWRRQLVELIGITVHYGGRELTLTFVDKEKQLATYFCSEKIIGASADQYPGLAIYDVGGIISAERNSTGYLTQENVNIIAGSPGIFVRAVSPTIAKRNHLGLLCEDAITNKVVNPAFASGLTSWTTTTGGGGTVTSVTDRLALPAEVTANSIQVVGAVGSENTYRQTIAVVSADGHMRLMFIHSDRAAAANPNWKVQRDFDSKWWDNAAAVWTATDTVNSTPSAWDLVNGLEIAAVFWSKAIPVNQNENWTVRIGAVNAVKTHNFYVVNLTAGKLRYSPLVNTTMTSPDIVKDVLDAGALFDERYELAGYDATWSAAEVVDAGNTYDEDANTADVSSPTLWGKQCLKVVQVTNPNAYRIHDGGLLASFYARCEFVVSATGVAVGDRFSFFRVSELAAANIALILWVNNNAGTLMLELEEFSSGSSNFRVGPPVVLGTRYIAELKWDFANLAWELRLGGQTLFSGLITDTTPTKAGTIKVGIESALANGSTIYFDNVAIDDLGYPELAGRQLHYAGHGTIELSMLAEQDVDDLAVAKHCLAYIQYGTTGKDYDAVLYEKPSAGAARFTYERWRDISGTSTLDTRVIKEIDIVRGTAYHVVARNIGNDLELGLTAKTMRLTVGGQNGSDAVATAQHSDAVKHTEIWFGSAPSAPGFKRAMNVLSDQRFQARVITDEEVRT